MSVTHLIIMLILIRMKKLTELISMIPTLRYRLELMIGFGLKLMTGVVSIITTFIMI